MIPVISKEMKVVRRGPKEFEVEEEENVEKMMKRRSKNCIEQKKTLKKLKRI